MKSLTSFFSKAPSNEGETNNNYNNNNTELGDKLKTSITKFDAKSIWLIPVISFTVIIVFVLLISILYLGVHQFQNGSNFAFSQNNKTSTLLNEVDNINTQIQQLAANPANSTDFFKSALMNINADLTRIEQSVTLTAKPADIDKVSAQLSSVKNDVDSQMLDIKRIVATGTGIKQYLDPSILPFQVISIDVLSEQPFVTIKYQNHVTPLAIGDTIAGWKVINADYDSSSVEFEGNKEFVKVSVQGQ